MTFQTGTYVKGDVARSVTTRREAVQAVWDGFVHTSQVSTEDASYRDLQSQARSLGLPANGSKASLAEAIATFQPEGNAGENPDAPETDDESLVAD